MKYSPEFRYPVGSCLAYTPGDTQPCIVIPKDKRLSFELTRRHNLVSVVTDLGLSNMPVMEGKCALLREFDHVDAFPLCICSINIDEIVLTIYLISSSFGKD